MISRRIVTRVEAFILLASAFGLASGTLAQQPGIVEPVDSMATRAPVGPADIAGFPFDGRGAFTFPPPYNTRGVRLTHEDDCSHNLPPSRGPVDCLGNIYSYWANTNNHVGRAEMLILVGLRSSWSDLVGEFGGRGPSLIRYHKGAETVGPPEPIFVEANFHPRDRAAVLALRHHTAESWYFGARIWSRFFVIGPDSRKLLAIDVDKQPRHGGPNPYMGVSTVFDISTVFPADRFIRQPHSSADETVHSATLARSLDNGNRSESLGCLVYRQATRRFLFFPEIGEIDECQVDKSGRWLWISEVVERTDPQTGGRFASEDNRVIDLARCRRRGGGCREMIIQDRQHALGHHDMGFGYAIGQDNYHGLPNAVRILDFSRPSAVDVVYHDSVWPSTSANHVAHGNARPTAEVPRHQQIACGSNATGTPGPRANELVCYTLEPVQPAPARPKSILVVAPNLTDVDAPGGGDGYTFFPKANLDVTGEYLVWMSNLGGGRMDLMMVRVPRSRLGGG